MAITHTVSDMMFHSLTKIIQATKTNQLLPDIIPAQAKDKILKYCQSHTHKQIVGYVPDDLVVQDFASTSGLDQATQLLSERGVVMLKSEELRGFAREAHAELKADLQQLLSRHALAAGEYYEDKDYLIQHGLAKLKHYKEISTYHKPVINIRAGESDAGMIDIFQLEQLVPQRDRIKRYHQDYLPLLERIIIPASNKYLRYRHTNLYYNHSVQTRPMHIDSLGQSQYRATMAKAFLYLHDVELEHGPHAYVVGSHRQRNINRFNYLYNLLCRGKASTDMQFYLPETAVPLTAEAGTLLLAFQTGVHGGLPQQSGYSRMVLVESFY